MARFTITLPPDGVCSGGNHLTFRVTGDRTATVRMDLSQITPALTEEDAEAFCRLIARLVKSGRTVAQARALLQAGVTVEI